MSFYSWLNKSMREPVSWYITRWLINFFFLRLLIWSFIYFLSLCFTFFLFSPVRWTRRRIVINVNRKVVAEWTHHLICMKPRRKKETEAGMGSVTLVVTGQMCFKWPKQLHLTPQQWPAELYEACATYTWTLQAFCLLISSFTCVHATI